MFYRSLVTPILFLFLVSTLSAQVETTDKADIIWSEKGRVDKKDIFDKLFSSGDYIYTLVKEKRKAELIQYDKQLKAQRSIDIDYRLERTRYHYIKSFQMAGRLYFIYREQTRSNMVSLVSFYVNLSSMTSDFKPVEIAKVNYDKKGGLSVHPIVSNDEEKVALIINTHIYHGGPLHFDIQMRTKDLALVWEKKDIDLSEYQEAHFEFKSFSLCKDGHLFILGIQYPNKNSKKVSSTFFKSSFVVFKVSENGEKIEETPVELPEKEVTSARMTHLSNGNLVVGGLYSTSESKVVEGAFLYYIHKISMEVHDQSTRAISASDLKSEKYSGYYKKKYYASFYVRDIFVDAKDNVKVVAEQEEMTKIKTKSSTPGNARTNSQGVNTYTQGVNTTSYDYYYYFSNLLVISGTPKGEINWVKPVKKDTKTENDDGSHGSFISHYDSEKDELSFIYRIDNPDDDGGLGKLFGQDPKVTMFTTVSHSGKINEEVLIDHNENGFHLIPVRSSVLESDNDFIVVMADRKRQDQLAGIKLK